MAESVAYQIVSAIAARLHGISVAAGYNTTPEVVVGVRFANDDQIADGPVVSVFETQDSPTEDSRIGGSQVVRLTVVCEAIARAGESSTLSLSRVWQDIIRAALDPSDTTLGGLALAVTRGPKEWEYPSPGGSLVAVRQAIYVDYLESYGNP